MNFKIIEEVRCAHPGLGLDLLPARLHQPIPETMGMAGMVRDAPNLGRLALVLDGPGANS
jgi:hypothetical protein